MTENILGDRSGVGCLGLIFIITILILLVTVGGLAAWAYYSQHCGDMHIDVCLQSGAFNNTPVVEEPGKAVTASGPYSFNGHSITVSAHIPLSGGKVTGSVSGDCAGRLTGSFDGSNNGTISGKIVGACSPFIIPIPASATFNGTVNKDSKSVPIGFSGKGGGFTHSGSMALSY